MKNEIAIATVRGCLGAIPFIGGLASEYAGLPSTIKQQKLITGIESRLSAIEIAFNEFVIEVAEKLVLIPDEKFIIPPINILFPIFETSKYHIEDKIIRSMFSELIANAMNSDTINKTHVAFVEIIKQLGSVDAVLLNNVWKRGLYAHLGRSFLSLGEPYVVTELIRYDKKPSKILQDAGLMNRSKNAFLFMEKKSHSFEETCNYFDSLTISLDNLLRLKLVDVIEVGGLPDKLDLTGYSKAIVDDFQLTINSDTGNNYRYEIKHTTHIIKLTEFGMSFCKIVLQSDNSKNQSSEIATM
jgi:hypothetical protein